MVCSMQRAICVWFLQLFGVYAGVILPRFMYTTCVTLLYDTVRIKGTRNALFRFRMCPYSTSSCWYLSDACLVTGHLVVGQHQGCQGTWTVARRRCFQQFSRVAFGYIFAKMLTNVCSMYMYVQCRIIDYRCIVLVLWYIFIFAYIFWHCISSISMINCLPCCRFACGSYGSFGAVWQPEDRHLWNASCVTTCLDILEIHRKSRNLKKNCSYHVPLGDGLFPLHSWRNSSMIVLLDKQNISAYHGLIDELVINMKPCENLQ